MPKLSLDFDSRTLKAGLVLVAFQVALGLFWVVHYWRASATLADCETLRVPAVVQPGGWTIRATTGKFPGLEFAQTRKSSIRICAQELCTPEHRVLEQRYRSTPLQVTTVTLGGARVPVEAKRADTQEEVFSRETGCEAVRALKKNEMRATVTRTVKFIVGILLLTLVISVSLRNPNRWG